MITMWDFILRGSYFCENYNSDFCLGQCEVGSNTSRAVNLKNNTNSELNFMFYKTAHFTVQPLAGTLNPRESLVADVVFSPSQFGSFAKRFPEIQFRSLVLRN